MPPEFSELVQQIILPFGMLLAGVIVGMALERFEEAETGVEEKNRLRWVREGRGGDILSGLWIAS